jgi:hypothetical protein
VLANQTFHLVYQAIRRVLERHAEAGTFGDVRPGDLRTVVSDIEGALENCARAVDACKTGRDISMGALQNEARHALYEMLKAFEKKPDRVAAVDLWFALMRDHFEARLF